jgi:hypothetical protein
MTNAQAPLTATSQFRLVLARVVVQLRREMRAVLIALAPVALLAAGCTMTEPPADSHPDSAGAAMQSDRATSSASREPPCPLDIKASGGTLVPVSCTFEKIIPGVNVNGLDANSLVDYALAVRGAKSGSIAQVSLFNFKGGLRNGDYRFDKDAGVREFNGQLLDSEATVRNLAGGTVTLQPQDARVHVSFSVSFDGGYTVSGSGTLPITVHNAP